MYFCTQIDNITSIDWTYKVKAPQHPNQSSLTFNVEEQLNKDSREAIIVTITSAITSMSQSMFMTKSVDTLVIISRLLLSFCKLRLLLVKSCVAQI